MPEPSAYETLATRVRRRFTGPRADRDRLAYLGEHFAAGGFALCTLIYLLPQAPFYPARRRYWRSWRCPAFLALVWPFAGGVLTLAVLAPPIFAYGAGWGVVYAVPAIVVMALLRWRRREWAALLPGVIPLAVTGWVGLALLPLAGVLLRRWGPLAGLLQRARAGRHRRAGGVRACCPTPSPRARRRCFRSAAPRLVAVDGAHRDRALSRFPAGDEPADPAVRLLLAPALSADGRLRGSGACGGLSVYLVLLLGGVRAAAHPRPRCAGRPRAVSWSRMCRAL